MKERYHRWNLPGRNSEFSWQLGPRKEFHVWPHIIIHFWHGWFLRVEGTYVFRLVDGKRLPSFEDVKGIPKED